MSDITLAAISLQRRTVGVAILRKTRIEEILLRQLSHELETAQKSTTEFLSRIMTRQRIEFVAFLKPTEAASERIRSFHQSAVQVVRDAGIPLLEVSAEELFASYGHPPLSGWAQLRRVGKDIWPMLNSTPPSINAALLGLHVQVERLIAIHSQQP
jgi:hypothetical protein